MKSLWAVVALVLLLGAWVLLAPSNAPDASDREGVMDTVNTVGRSMELPLRPADPASRAADAREPVKAPSAPDTAPAGGLADGLDARIEDASVKAGLLKADEGEIIADGSYIIRGSGTESDPYEVSWDLLQSCSNTYVPRLGEKVIPQRIAILHDKWVTIAGYIAFPIVATESDELLAMLNQWDGCCIGIPPSPYDAVEVKLKTPVEVGLRHQIRFASITGVFRVQPYVMERWLVGLYLMDQARIAQDL